MTVSDTRRDHAPGPTTVESAASPALSRRTLGWSGVVIVGLILWFFIAWRGLGRTLIDSAGESIGTGFLMLVIASTVGAFRNRRGG